MKPLVLVALLVAFVMPVFGQTTGNDLLRDCQVSVKPESTMTPEDFVNATHCLGYVSGVIDTFSLWRDASAAKNIQQPNLPCFPNGHLENLQVVRIVLKFMQDHPEKLHWNGPEIILAALRNAFPCK